MGNIYDGESMEKTVKCDGVERWLLNPETNKIDVIIGNEIIHYEITPRIDRWCDSLPIYTWYPRINVTLVVDSKSFWKRLMAKLFRRRK